MSWNIEYTNLWNYPFFLGHPIVTTFLKAPPTCAYKWPYLEEGEKCFQFRSLFVKGFLDKIVDHYWNWQIMQHLEVQILTK